MGVANSPRRPQKLRRRDAPPDVVRGWAGGIAAASAGRGVVGLPVMMSRSFTAVGA